ncbi:hypothetical protein PT974_10890 [Cladobotryum mycophilum]|uniref:Uncharacterized protein n=1 Tax=Cladobotryum mycophilum TaxID=491253 RepID=A0ABR0SC01_9HYPO
MSSYTSATVQANRVSPAVGANNDEARAAMRGAMAWLQQPSVKSAEKITPASTNVAPKGAVGNKKPRAPATKAVEPFAPAVEKPDITTKGNDSRLKKNTNKQTSPSDDFVIIPSLNEMFSQCIAIDEDQDEVDEDWAVVSEDDLE